MERFTTYLVVSAIIFGLLTFRDMVATDNNEEPVKEYPDLKDPQPVVPILRFQYW